MLMISCRNQRSCSYFDTGKTVSTAGPTSRSSTAPSSSTQTLDAVQASASPQQEPSREYETQQTVAAARFLDRALYEQSLSYLSITAHGVSPPVSVRHMLSNRESVREIITLYFERINPWLPIISKDKIYNSLLNPLVSTSSHAQFLCLCMALLTRPSHTNEDVRHAVEYVAAKRYLAELEQAGLMSLEILQGCILIAVYELGHGIYPAAYLSIAVCVKYGIALGLSFESLELRSLEHWVSQEEGLRTWWAVFLIEQYAPPIL